MKSHEGKPWRKIIKENHEEKHEEKHEETHEEEHEEKHGEKHKEKHEEKHEDHLIESFESCWENMKVVWLW